MYRVCFFLVALGMPCRDIAVADGDASFKAEISKAAFWNSGDTVSIGFVKRRIGIYGGDKAGVCTLQLTDDVSFDRKIYPSSNRIEAVCCDPRGGEAPRFLFARNYTHSVDIEQFDAATSKFQSITSIDIPWTFRSRLVAQRDTNQVWVISPNGFAVGSEEKKAMTDVVCFDLAQNKVLLSTKLKGIPSGCFVVGAKAFLPCYYVDEQNLRPELNVLDSVNTTRAKRIVVRFGISHLRQHKTFGLVVGLPDGSFFHASDIDDLDDREKLKPLLVQNISSPWRNAGYEQIDGVGFAGLTNFNRGQNATHLVSAPSDDPRNVQVRRRFDAKLIAMGRLRSEVILVMDDQIVVTNGVEPDRASADN